MSENNKAVGTGVRPIFIPKKNGVGVLEQEITFDWHMGMSKEVRRRSVQSLHEQAKQEGYARILEASSKSDQEIGIRLSAFFLKNIKGYPVENLFQSSKVFENGGQYLDLLHVSPRDAKRDSRLKTSGKLLTFRFNRKDYPLEPYSLFYDWLYLNVLFSDRNVDLRNEFFDLNFDAFSDIEFNPKKSFSCQARTLALCVSLHENRMVKDFIGDPVGFAAQCALYEKSAPQASLL